MLTQTVALASVCSDPLESAFPVPTSDGNCACSPVVWAPGLWWEHGALGPAVRGNTRLEAKCSGVNAPLNKGQGINSGKTFLSAKTAEKPQLEQVGWSQDVKKEEEASLCTFWHLQCQLLSLL